MARTERTVQDEESDFIIFTNTGWQHTVSGNAEDLNKELKRIVKHHRYKDMKNFRVFKRII